MTLLEELQINIAMSNYNQRSGSYSANYDYILLDNLSNCSYASSFRSDLKNLKIRTWDGTNCPVLYVPKYGSQPAAILARIPADNISQTTKLILEVHDTTFSSTLTTGGEVLMYDAFKLNVLGRNIQNSDSSFAPSSIRKDGFGVAENFLK